MEPIKNIIAGIVPVAGQRSDFNFDFHDCMVPLGPDYLAIERAVYECAFAGCSSIWVVCNDDIAPLIRRRMKDFILDPIYEDFKFSKRKFFLKDVKNQKLIPIFYVPVHPKFRDRVDSLAFSIVQGAMYANKVAKRISEASTPSMFYVAFPFGAYEPTFIRSLRKEMTKGNTVMACYNNESIKTGAYLGFSFKPEKIKDFFSKIKEGARKTYRDEDGELVTLPKEKQFRSRYFTLQNIFNDYESDVQKNIRWYYGIYCWHSYRNFLATDQNYYLNLRKPKFLRARHISEFKYKYNEEI
jgi:hypothetical protein